MSKFLNETGLQYFWSKLKTLLNNKVDKISGKQLSSEDYTSSEKTKLAGLSNYDDTALVSRVDDLEENLSNVSLANDGTVSKFPSTTGGFLKNAGVAGGTWTSISVGDLPTSNDYTIGVVKTNGDLHMKAVYEPSSNGDGSEISVGDTASGKAQLGRANCRWSRIYGVTVDATYINGTNLTLTNPLSVGNGGTGCTSLDDLKDALDIESFSEPTVVDETTLDTLDGTVVFVGTNEPFGTDLDWSGIQVGKSKIGSNGDVFQLATVNLSDKKLLFRKKDLNEWSEWKRICFYDELPTIDSTLSSSSTNPVQNKVINTALNDKLDSSTVDSSGTSGTSGWYNCRISNGKIQYYNKDTTYSIGTAAAKNYTTSVTSGSSDLITSGAVYTGLSSKMNNSDKYTALTLTAASNFTIVYKAYLILGNFVYIDVDATATAAIAANTSLTIATLSNYSSYKPFNSASNIALASHNVSQTYMKAWYNKSNGYLKVHTNGQSLNSGDVIKFKAFYALA